MNEYSCQCSCQSIKFFVPDKPCEIAHCYCQICRFLHKDQFGRFAKYDLNQIKLDFSQLKRMRSSNRATRYRCSQCNDWIAMIYNDSSFIWLVTDNFLFDTNDIETYDIYKDEHTF